MDCQQVGEGRGDASLPPRSRKRRGPIAHARSTGGRERDRVRVGNVTRGETTRELLRESAPNLGGHFPKVKAVHQTVDGDEGYGLLVVRIAEPRRLWGEIRS